jgi:hypothetical protein
MRAGRPRVVPTTASHVPCGTRHLRSPVVITLTQGWGTLRKRWPWRRDHIEKVAWVFGYALSYFSHLIHM